MLAARRWHQRYATATTGSNYAGPGCCLGQDGFTVCQRLRRDERTVEIPVLMLMALSQT